jgi:mannose-6-phosphate isomerase-like protein (cupin superfamily)
MRLTSTSRASAEHYSWGRNCEGWHLLKDVALSVIEEQMPPSSSEVLHSHCIAQQFFFLLSGDVIMEVEHDEVQLHAGEGLHIPPRIRHRICNRSQESARFLVISQPPSHGDRIVEEPGT